ncbi:DinB family protein [Paractinoplanes globisporus]|uniref:DinB family protein n=1 Tax=Paractinoplanes globisporus TaxID=113565 RepID=A0ABW6WLX3_9ACTN|nr:DinB family protein [Actinoplanes globisporus]
MSDFYPRLRAGEREMLEQFLEQHRESILRALDGLDDADARRRLLPSTAMTIGGIVKHLAHMEDLWFTHKFAGRDYPPPWPGGDEEWAWRSAAEDSVGELRALYAAACGRSRAVAAEHPSLDATAALPSFGKGPVSLRWLHIHLIRETAQHRGHVDTMLDVVRNRA